MKPEVIEVPTGRIIVLEGAYGKMECLSIGDYGKASNIKADFLGLKEEIHGVRTTQIMPLEEKWVMTLSTQYGCSMGCTFCDVPSVGRGINCTEEDLIQQVVCAREQFPDVVKTKRLNIHFARMGEPTFNRDVWRFAHRLQGLLEILDLSCDTVHPVLSTMMPANNHFLRDALMSWTAGIKNWIYHGEAGLQISINSTHDGQRKEMFRGSSLSLGAISSILDGLPTPVGRKYALNFALADGYEVDGTKLAIYFDPNKFMVKITPIHITSATERNDIVTTNGYDEYTPYREAEESCKAAGFDTLVFVPSRDEDESLITCGNAVLAGRSPKLASRTPRVEVPQAIVRS